MKSLVIIDDEFNPRQSLRTLINELCPDINIVGEANGVASGYVLIRQTKPDIVLLDVTMEDGTGFDLLDKFPRPDFRTIFITAHEEFALKAFRYNAIDYLLKPVNPAELIETLDKISNVMPVNYFEQLDNLLESNKTQKLNKIMLSSMDGMIFVSLDDIVRLESEGSYSYFYFVNKERHLITRSLKEFEELFPADRFFRLHLSHLINVSHVKKILREDGGYALMQDGGKVPIARRRREEFMEMMKQKVL